MDGVNFTSENKIQKNYKDISLNNTASIKLQERVVFVISVRVAYSRERRAKTGGMRVRERYNSQFSRHREVKQISTAGATTAAVTEKVWGEYTSVVCPMLSLAMRIQRCQNSSI